jgi:hypothetical protein
LEIAGLGLNIRSKLNSEFEIGEIFEAVVRKRALQPKIDWQDLILKPEKVPAAKFAPKCGFELLRSNFALVLQEVSC